MSVTSPLSAPQEDCAEASGAVRCRHCKTIMSVRMADLGLSPIANDYIDPARYAAAEPFYSLEVYVCSNCNLAQTRDLLDYASIFRDDYAYFSSTSETWLKHASHYVDAMAERFNLGTNSFVLEIASNDGYLLQFVQKKGIPCLGIEPCRSVAESASAKGIPTKITFFNVSAAERLKSDGVSADLIVANNVLAHLPDINDFIGGVRMILKLTGVATFEVQHLLRLMQSNQFDTIYHEHFSYLSLISAKRIFEHCGLRVFDVEELGSHGGSLRFFVCRDDAPNIEVSPNLEKILSEERGAGLHLDATYRGWDDRIRMTKRALLSLLIDIKNAG